MPNWCKNELAITGPEKDLKRFKDDHKVQVVIDAEASDDKAQKRPWFGVAVPEPDVYPDIDDWLGSMLPGWYAWRLSNWGCRWDAKSVTGPHETDSDGAHVLYGFMTPVRPPRPWLVTISELYPELEFVLLYWDPQWPFRGAIIARRGSLQESYEGPELAKDSLADVYVDLDEQVELARAAPSYPAE